MAKCRQCGKRGPMAEDQTDPGMDELAVDARGLVAPNECVCGACLEAAEDVRTQPFPENHMPTRTRRRPPAPARTGPYGDDHV